MPKSRRHATDEAWQPWSCPPVTAHAAEDDPNQQRLNELTEWLRRHPARAPDSACPPLVTASGRWPAAPKRLTLLYATFARGKANGTIGAITFADERRPT